MKERPQEDNFGFLQARWRPAVGASRELVGMCVSTAATQPLQWGSAKKRLCNAKESSLLSWHHYNRAMHSCAFCSPEKSGGAYKTEGVFWVQFHVIVFWWCINTVLQEFITILMYFEHIEIRIVKGD